MHKKYSSVVLSGLLVVTLSACSSATKNDSPPANAGTIPDELTLKEDRAKLAELRKDIPEDVQRENDEAAFILKNMSGMDEEPTKVRDRFQTALRKQREKMDKGLRKERDDYSAQERKEREAFLKKLQADRDKFNRSKRDSKERTRFFNDQDRERQDYFAEQKDKRKDFEEKTNDKRKNLEDYYREQSNKFNQEYRGYAEAFNERKRALELKKRMEQKDQRLKQQAEKSAQTPATLKLDQAPGQGTGEATARPAGMTAEDEALLLEMAKHKGGKIKPLRTQDSDASK